jgi:hypothetical protein
MFSSKKKHHTGLTRKEALAAIPMINTEVTIKKCKNGELLLTYPIILRPWLLKLFQRLGKTASPTYRKLQLDILGASVWSFIDGKRTVGGVIEKFAQAHRLHPKEAEVSVTQFLRSLGQRGIIGMRS